MVHTMPGRSDAMFAGRESRLVELVRPTCPAPVLPPCAARALPGQDYGPMKRADILALGALFFSDSSTA